MAAPTRVPKRKDYAIVGMVQNTVSGTDVVAALHGAFLQWAMARYGAYFIPTTSVLPGFGAGAPVLDRGLALSEAVVGLVQSPATSALEVTVYVPMVTTAVNPAYTSYFVPRTQNFSPMLTLGVFATGAWAIKPRLENTSVHLHLLSDVGIVTNGFNGIAISTDLDMPPVNAAGIGHVQRSLPLAAFNAVWRTTTTSSELLGTDLSAVAGSLPNRVRGVTLPDLQQFAVSVQEDGTTKNTLPNMVVYLDQGGVAFTAGLTTSEVPLVSSLLKEIDDPGFLLRVPYLAPFASADVAGASVTYSNDGDLYVLTWSSTNPSTSLPVVSTDTAQFEFQLQYNSSSGVVSFLYRTMPNVWSTNNWLVGTTMTSEFVAATVETTQLLAVDTLPQVLDLVAFGLASPRSNLVFVQSTDGSALVGQGALAPIRLPDGAVTTDVS